MSATAPVLGLLAGALGIIGTVPYVRDTLRGTTRPHRGTWFIWSALAIIVVLSQYADGASWSLVAAVVSAVLTSIVFALALQRGEGRLRPGERAVIAVAGIGVVGWLVAREPVVGTSCVIAADLLGVAMMIPKIYREPASETLATFSLAGISGAAAAGAVGGADLSLLLYPVYYLLANGALALLICVRREALARSGVPPRDAPSHGVRRSPRERVVATCLAQNG